jgi:(+)-beta-caryophyllene/(+)-caryolan-1-ol synthase
MQIVLPDFYMPFPENGVNPAFAATFEEPWQWADHFGIIPTAKSRANLERTRPNLISARYHPTARASAFPLLVEFMMFGWCVDEEFDDGAVGRDAAWCRRSIESLVVALNGGVCTNALARAAADLRKRACAGRSTSWQKGFITDVTCWLWNYYVETVDRCTGRFPPIAKYRLIREKGSGEAQFMDLSEIGLGIDLSEAVRRLPGFVTIRSMAEQHMGIYNDIWSISKELAVGYYHNAAILFAHHEQVPLQVGVVLANNLLTDCVEQILAAERELPKQLKAAGITGQEYDDALTMVQAYKDQVRGNFDWHFETQRYQDREEITGSAPNYVPNLFATENT